MPSQPRWLLHPTAKQLTLGGDARLIVDPESGLNRYGCSPMPRDEAFSFASSTATSISRHGYEAACRLHDCLFQDETERIAEDRLHDVTSHLASTLTRTLQIDTRKPGVLLSASGTDSQMHATAIVACSERSPLVSVVCGSDETGSGTPYSVTGRHFDGVTAVGHIVEKGTRIQGFPEIQYLGVPFRDDRGRNKSPEELDQEVRQAVAHSVHRGYVVLLHLMDQSKLGCMAPSLNLVDELRQRFGDAVQVIVDACQLRLDMEDLATHLDRNHIVLITGSKFFTGPPFSGASLYPSSMVERWSRTNHRLPSGLSNYLDRCTLPDWLARATPPLPAPADIGMRLRWTAALEEMSRYFAIPRSERIRLLDDFGLRIKRILDEYPELQPIQSPHQRSAINNNGQGPELSSRPTLIPFRIAAPGHDTLPPEQAGALYQLLNQELTQHSMGRHMPHDLSSRACHIGQPVPLGNGLGAAMRISIGARIIAGCRDPETSIVDSGFLKVEEEKLRTVCSKIQFLARAITRSI
ncbi:hypothetical protein D893_00390 [Thioalkalivibrio sp. ALE21]|nr:hypothetical protein D893_00390 [Thioalkalivibrio sp. ALE21]